jgi:hypothetical protein
MEPDPRLESAGALNVPPGKNRLATGACTSAPGRAARVGKGLGRITIAAALASGAACVHHANREVVSVPVYQEVEPNNDPFSANYFGRIRPGDHFFIDGWIDSGPFDPFDGFAFTADSALHVDFQLWIDDPSSDLDVCLYDPQADLILDCFQTSNNPERGGVDVYAGNLDFHLVVQSFLGSSTYSLEIVVTPLYAATTALHAHPIAAAPIDGEPGDGRDPGAFEPYRKTPREDRVLRELQVIRIDPATGETRMVLEVHRR